MTTDDSLILHRCTADDKLSTTLEKILRLSNSIFGTEPQSKYASFDEWKRRLSAPGSVVVYLAPQTSPALPVAFLFTHPRHHSPPLAHGETDSLHIWLAGVTPEKRKEGCLATMVAALGFIPVLTVCTTPDVYPDMWRWLMGRGWSVERELSGGKVMLSKTHQMGR
ncbi:hypothetical protein DAEQUDRAFT_731331 [Daedalea quercina L-15889]|uniref:N-acetyltransferase domain-containing protein n=1 Tax=Daedalea quercina L-15889 TaxID=1314783 RepID=A0A165MCV8_9APHY|nr:hypothetical protein DAEQUDRAFT_731331 [Daedalea quercina L-15889]